MFQVVRIRFQQDVYVRKDSMSDPVPLMEMALKYCISHFFGRQNFCYCMFKQENFPFAHIQKPHFLCITERLN